MGRTDLRCRLPDFLGNHCEICARAPPQYWSADEVFTFYMNRNLQIRAGMVGVLFFAPFYFVWSAVLSRIMRHMEGPDGVLSSVELLGGVCTTVTVLSW
jgi:hypothetical protein